MHEQWPQEMASAYSGDLHEHGPAGSLPTGAYFVSVDWAQQVRRACEGCSFVQEDVIHRLDAIYG
jgi:hypothetical protein